MDLKSWFRNRGYLYLFLTPALLFLIGFTLYPVLYNIIISFQEVDALTLTAPEKEFVGFANYAEILTDFVFTTVLKNSLVFTLGSVFFQFVIGFALAIFLSKKFPLNNMIRGLIVIGWIIPPVIVGTVWRWLLNTDFGLFNFILRQIGILSSNISWLTNPRFAMVGIIVANVWFGIPFNMMLMIGGITGLPKNIYEAAEIDGANWFQCLIYLTIPMLKQTIAATITLGFIYTFKVFALIWVMTGGGPVDATNVLPIWSYRLSFDYFNFSEGAVVANIMFVIMFLFSLVYLRIAAKGDQ